MTDNESKVLEKFSKLMVPPILEVGSRHESHKISNPREYFPDQEYLGVDIQAGEGVDLVHNMEQPLDRKFNAVICCSVLEHTERPWLVAENIERCLNPDGWLFVAAPFVWRFHSYPNDYWRFSGEAFKILFPNIEWKFIKYASGYDNVLKSSYKELSDVYKMDAEAGTIPVTVIIAMGRKRDV